MEREPRIGRAPLGAALACAALWACAGRAPAESAPGTPSSLAEAVAVVDGQPITAAAVARQAASAGVSARAALDQLIDAELLVAEARRRGLAGSAEEREAAAGEAVRRMLARGFEQEVTAAAITDDDLRLAYARKASEYDHPELREVVHVLVPFPGAKEPDAERKQALRRRADEVAERAAQVRSAAEMQSLAPALSDGEITLKAEQLTTPRAGVTVTAFAEAAFALPRPGAVSGVVETRFGFHVLFLVRVVPERHAPLPEVATELREALWPEVRRREFARFVDHLADQHRVELHPDRLEEAGTP